MSNNQELRDKIRESVWKSSAYTVALVDKDIDGVIALFEEYGKEELLKRDIKYHTLKARLQRTYLGGEEQALPTKRYVKRLKRQLASLQQERKK